MIRASAEGAPYLFAETSEIRDANGLPFKDIFDRSSNIGGGAGGPVKFVYSYQWIRIDGVTQTNVGTDSPRYNLVEADYGKNIKVEVSFTDQDSFQETVTSDPVPAVRRITDVLLTAAALVSNTGQTQTADATITKQYAMGFTLGDHGQGYELSTVSIELAAVPADLTVSLWIADHADKSGTLETRLYDFKNPATFAVGANEFTAPPGALLYPNIQYAVVLSGYTTLSIKETTSDAEDATGDPGAVLADKARIRNLTESGRWGNTLERNTSAADRETGTNPNIETPVLRLAISGYKRQSGILASTYGQTASDDQEIISLGDLCCMRVDLGAADRYLIRGFSWNADDSTELGGGITNPFELRDGSTTGDQLFRLFITRNIAGVPEWTAPRGATVAGGTDNPYFLSTDWNAYDHIHDGTRTGHTLTRVFGTQSESYDTPLALGVSFSQAGDVSIPQFLAAILGEPLYALVQNVGQADANYASVGGTNNLRAQAFTTGSDTDGYRLQGIGVNIEGSADNGVPQVPDDATSVTVSLYSADADDLPDTKQFDLISPDEYAPGLTFFEAPPGKTLAASTTYVMVWTHNGGTRHRLQRTASNGEDSGAFGGATVADVYYTGSQVASLTADVSNSSLEIAVYTDDPPAGTVVYTDISHGNATGIPVVLASAESGGAILATDTWRIKDEDGLPYTGTPSAGIDGYVYAYQWFRVNADETQTEVGTDSQRYQLTDADYGNRIKVRVSFVDRGGNREIVDSLPYGPMVKPPPSAAPRTLIGNTGQTPAVTTTINADYAMGFRLGTHGQGYEISSVKIDLAAVPSTLSVSLWNGGPRGSSDHGFRTAKVLDFENPASLQAGLNTFTAPAGAFAYQNLNYWIVLSDFGSSMSIRETSSDDEDTRREEGAILFNTAGGNSNVLRLAIEGSKRQSGILASNYGQPIIDDMGTDDPADDTGPNQEIISVGDVIGWEFGVGEADRYLVRGVTFAMDDTTSRKPGFINPFWLRSESITGDRQFDLTNTRPANGTPAWTAPQGATVEGGCTTTTEMMVEVVTCKQYVLDWGDFNVNKGNGVDRIGGVLTRYFAAATNADGVSDDPTAPGVSLALGNSVTENDAAGPTPLMAIHGEPLIAMVKNFGETDNSYFTAGATYKVVSQGFTTGSDLLYRLQGIGFDIEGSVDTNMVAQIPDDAASVAVAVHTDINGKPGEKLFDLLSPTDYAAGHSFFEAPPGTYLTPNTSYVLVWTYLGGTEHRLRRTAGDDEDSGARTGASIANGLNRGADLSSLIGGTNALEIAVYTEILTKAPLVEGGIDVPLSWPHIPDGVEVGYQFRVLFVTHRGTLPTSGEIEDYNGFVQWEADHAYNDSVIRNNAPEFKAVACTAALDARTNTRMNDFIGVPVHWLDGGWEHRPTLVANSNTEFYSATWVNAAYGAYVTGNSAQFEDHAMVWTGCDASGVAHPEFHMGNTSAMNTVAVGTPRGRSLKTREESVDTNFAPLGAVDVTEGYAYREYEVVIDGQEHDRLLRLYAISPIFTVVDDGSERTIWSSSMTVGTSRTSVGTATVDRAGVGANHGRLLGSTQFTYEGTSYSIARLQTEKRSLNGVVSRDTLKLPLSLLFPASDDSKLALELICWGSCRGEQRLRQTRFLLSEATRTANEYEWTNHGLTWGDGDEVVIRLIELREGVESDSPPVVDLPPVVKISADSPLVPTGLRSRDRFRLMFLSSTQRNAQSTNIADYNKFVQDRAAAGHADIRAHSAGFRAVACTEAVDARDNTGTNGIGLGIWWLGGAKAVDNYVDFYDGSWDEEVNVRDESGAAVTIPFSTDAYDTWTGCGSNGTELVISSISGALGTTNPGHGRLNESPSSRPLNSGGEAKASLNYLYGLSYIFEVR